MRDRGFARNTPKQGQDKRRYSKADHNSWKLLGERANLELLTEPTPVTVITPQSIVVETFQCPFPYKPTPLLAPGVAAIPLSEYSTSSSHGERLHDEDPLQHSCSAPRPAHRALASIVPRPSAHQTLASPLSSLSYSLPYSKTA